MVLWAAVFGAGAQAQDAPKLVEMSIGSAQIHFVIASLNKFDLRVLAAKVPLSPEQSGTKQLNLERMASGFGLRDYSQRYGALAVLPGGYIDSYSPPTPLGLVRSDGIQISQIHRSWLLDGIICNSAGVAPRIELIDKASELAAYRDCVQSGPVLLLKGDTPPQSTDPKYQRFSAGKYERTFLCLNGRNQVVIGVSDRIDLPSLASGLRSGDLGCVDAITFTGSASAGLQFGARLIGHDDFLYPSVIAIMPKGR